MKTFSEYLRNLFVVGFVFGLMALLMEVPPVDRAVMHVMFDLMAESRAAGIMLCVLVMTVVLTVLNPREKGVESVHDRGNSPQGRTQ